MRVKCMSMSKSLEIPSDAAIRFRRLPVEGVGVDPDVAIARPDYLHLLVRAGVTDPDAWPESARRGAVLLTRIREIESACVASHGRFDCDLLERGVEDEYEALLAEMERLINPELESYIEKVKAGRRSELGL
jgi:hypothetical protein